MSRRALSFLAALLFGLAVAPQATPAQETLTIFAAASLRNALDETNTAFTGSTGIEVVASYAATSALAKQLQTGAPADVFLSADLNWMGFAAEHNLIDPGTRVNLLGNKLVLIAARDSKLGHFTIVRSFDIAKLAGDGRIAAANVTAVPAGRYAKAALQSLGVWGQAEPKLAQAENVRAALAYVSRGETAIGVVYATDAKADPGVKIIGEFPAGSYPPVTYPVAATAAAKPAAARYLQFLRTPQAKAIFESHGFDYLIRPVS